MGPYHLLGLGSLLPAFVLLFTAYKIGEGTCDFKLLLELCPLELCEVCGDHYAELSRNGQITGSSERSFFVKY